MLLPALSPLALLAVLAAPSFAQLTFTPAGQVQVNDNGPNTPIKFKLASQPKGNVDVYFEAPNFSFNKCKVSFTPQNWSTDQTVEATALPVFGDFQAKVEMKLKTSAKDAGDTATLDAKDLVYNLVRTTATAGTCQVFADPHYYTFDNQKFDIHNMDEHCMSMVWSPNLIVQIKTVKHDAKITLVREMAIRYNKAVVFFKADAPCQAGSTQDVINKAGIAITVAGQPNKAGYTATFKLSDGTIITATNSMVAASDGKWTFNMQIQAPCYLRKQNLQGLCGNFNGNPTDDNLDPTGKVVPLKPPTVWLPDAGDLARSWKCMPNANLFDCTDKCTGFPAAPPPVADSKMCSIALGLKADTPAGYETQTALQGYEATANADPKPAPAPTVDPEIIKKAEELCNKIFAKDDCKDKFVSQDSYLKQCLTDAKAMQSLAAADGIRNKYMEALDAFTKPIGQDPKNPLNKVAFDCRKKLGLGMNECLNSCSGADKGTCIAGGCKCKEGFTGDDCSTVVPKAVAAAAPAACTESDIENYDAAFKPVSYDKCKTITGEPGIFDDDSDGKKVTKTDIKVCSDRGVGKYCIYIDGQKGSHLNCTADDTANDNKYGTICTSGYEDNGACWPKASTDVAGIGKCMAKGAHVDSKKFDVPPCSHASFAKVTIPAGEKRFFCIGLKGSHLLQCPDNIIKKCDSGTCVSKYENMGKPDERPCGKAACSAAKAAAANKEYVA